MGAQTACALQLTSNLLIKRKKEISHTCNSKCIFCHRNIWQTTNLCDEVPLSLYFISQGFWLKLKERNNQDDFIFLSKMHFKSKILLQLSELPKANSGQWGCLLETWLMWLWWVKIPTKDLTDVALVSEDTDKDKYDEDENW